MVTIKLSKELLLNFKLIVCQHVLYQIESEEDDDEFTMWFHDFI